MSKIAQTLAQRQKTHGNFATHSEISQKLKAVMYESEGWQDLPYEHCEALEMIAHKIARILNGDPCFIDSWRDVCGYSQLVVNKLTNFEGATDVKVTRQIVKNGELVDAK